MEVRIGVTNLQKKLYKFCNKYQNFVFFSTYRCKLIWRCMKKYFQYLKTKIKIVQITAACICNTICVNRVDKTNKGNLYHYFFSTSIELFRQTIGFRRT